MGVETEILTDLSQFTDESVSVLEAALALAALHRPGSDVAAARAKVEDLVAQVRRTLPIKPHATQMAAILADILVHRHRFGPGGDEADGHEVPQLLEHGRAGHDTIAILWLSVATAAGLDCEMLAFPMHALIRLVDHAGGRVIVECADGRLLDSPALRVLHKLDAGPGAELDPDFFTPLSARQALLRWRQSLKMHHLRQGRMQTALAMVESCLLFAPAKASLWREAGLMRLRLDDLAGAAAALEQFVQREDNALARGRGKQLLAEIRSRMN